LDVMKFGCLRFWVMIDGISKIGLMVLVLKFGLSMMVKMWSWWGCKCGI
jgi:hypothetical protein